MFLSNLYFIFMSIIKFIESNQMDSKNETVESKMFFWFNIGIFVFSISSIIAYLSSFILPKQNTLVVFVELIWAQVLIANILKNLLISKGVLEWKKFI